MQDIEQLTAVQGPADPRKLAELATRQHGVVARWQLLALGFSRSQIQWLIDAGHLHPVHRGVYAVGHRRLTTNARRMAAVLACGPKAVLSHASAVAQWGLRPPPSGPIHVLVPGNRVRRDRDGIRVHGARHLAPADRRIRDGIPTTSIPRTLLDYASVADPQQVRLAIEAAERFELFDLRAVTGLLERIPGHRGRAKLRGVLEQIIGPPAETESELERDFLALIRAAGLPEPKAQVLIAGHRVDLFWPGPPSLIVELDSWAFHKSRAEFEADRRRDTKLQLVTGCPVMRVTNRRIREEPDELVADVRSFLSASSARAASDR